MVLLVKKDTLATELEQSEEVRSSLTDDITRINEELTGNSEDAVQKDEIEARELVKLQQIPSEGPGEQAKPSNQTGQDGSADPQSNNHEPNTPSSSSKDKHKWDPSANNPEYSRMEGLGDEGIPSTVNSSSQQRQDSSTIHVSNCTHKVSHPLENVISPLDRDMAYELSSIPSPLPSPDHRKSPIPKRLVLGSEGTSSQKASHEGDPALPVNLNETPAPTAQDEDRVVQPNGDGATEIWANRIPTILQSEEGKKEETSYPRHREEDHGCHSVEESSKYFKERRLTRDTVLDDEAPSSQLIELDTENPPQVVEDSPKTGGESHRSRKARAKGKQLAILKEPSEELGATVKKPTKKVVIEESSKDKGAARLIEAQRRGTEEIDRLTMLFTQKEADLALLKVEHKSGKPGAMLELKNENALLKDENIALKKQLKDLTQQMLCDQRATNERIDKLLSKL
ncbi:hypothetical protein HAX54_013876 [Datura stramonium]|uniref:Uncharacterized protein n=1 Tax=Datura stramonium TaxID=4076 RepID=A0ABS8TPU9_DATST|nr:hypothetical protein [Datura stramonium]